MYNITTMRMIAFNVFITVFILVKKVDELKIEGNRRRGRPKKKWMGVIEEDTRVCEINKNMVRDMEGWREIIRGLDLFCVE